MAQIGSVLGGRYRLVELLGQGGMATVYRGHDAQLGRDVAVKVLRSEYGRDPDFLARFRAEAQAVASLNDPNIVAVFDFGQEDAGPYIVMEYVDGEDLATLLRRNGSLPPRQAARIARDVGRALAAAHDRGIVHRDIKPGNVLIANDGRVKVTDFGIARALSEAQLTLPGTTLGSVHYLSPEQVRGEPASVASDIYGLGIVLYEMLAGRRPWEGDTAASVAMGRLTGAAPGPSDVVAAVPPALDAIDRKALAPDPAERFPSAGAMAEILAGYLTSTSAGAVAGMPVSGSAPARGSASGAVPAASAPRATPVTPARSTASARTALPAGPIPYAVDAYAAPTPQVPTPQRRPVAPEPEPGPAGTSPWAWISGLVGIGVLIVAGLLIFRLVGGGPSTTGLDKVSAPSLVGQDIEAARVTASDLGLLLAVTTRTAADQRAGTIVEQDPTAGTSVDKGSSIKVVVITGPETVAVPDVRFKGEVDGVAAIVAAGLINGTRTDAFDPVVPSGAIIGTNPQSGTLVARDTKVDYVVSKGLEPTPSASASPSASPSPSPTVTLEPTATPAPTVTATPAPIVGDYRCLTLEAATAQLQADGFTQGTVVTNPPNGAFDGTWLVQAQVPTPGESRPAGTPIRMTVIAPTNACP